MTSSRPTGATRARAYRSRGWAGVVDVLLLVLPALAVAGPWVSIDPGAAGQLYGYRLVGLLALPVAAVLAWRRRHDRFLQLVTVGLAWIVGWAALSLLWTDYPAAGRTEVAALTSSVLWAWVSIALTEGRRRRARLLALGWVLAAVAGLLVALVEVSVGYHLAAARKHQEFAYRHAVVAGFMNNPNAFGCSMVTGLGAMLAALTLARRWPTRVAAGVGALLCALAVIATNSRGATLAATTLSLLALVGALVWRARLGRTVALALAATAATSTLLTVGLDASTIACANVGVNPLACEERARLEPGAAPAAPRNDSAEQQEADSERVLLIRTALRYFGEKPLTGQGAGTFISRIGTDPAWNRPPLNTHNLPAQWLAHYGVVGALPLVALVLAAAWRVRPRRGLSPALTLAALGGLGGFGATSLLTADATGEPFTWAALALGLAMGWAQRPGGRSALSPRGAR